MTGGRELGAAAGLAAAAAGLLLLALGQPWAEASVTTEGMPRAPVVVTGTEALAWLRALGFVALAAIGAVLVTSGRWRRAVGALLSGVGAAVAAGSALAGDAVDAALLSAARATAAGADNAAVDAATTGAGESAWRWLAATAGLLIAVAGAFVVIRGAGWPGMSRRYDRAPGATPHTPHGPADPPAPVAARRPKDPSAPAGGGVRPATLDEQDAWRALDQGRDPTD